MSTPAHRIATFAVAACLALGVPLGAVRADPSGDTFSAVPKESSITYQIVHKLHKVRGTSTQAQGAGRLLPNGTVQVMVRVPVESFDSGNANRDAHMKEVVDAARFPTVELKAVAEGVTPPASYPATIQRTFKGELTFHGLTRPVEVPAKLTFESPDRVKVATDFSISLDGFKVERPSLLFVKVDDAAQIDVNMVFKKGGAG